MSEHILEITNSDESDSFIANNNLAVIFFGSVRCPHCRTMVPVYQELANKYKSVAFAHVEVSLVEVNDLDGVPTFAGYKNHVPVASVIGSSPDGLISMIEKKLLS